MAILGNPKNVFWEAFLLTAVVFIFGLFLGIALENSRVSKINDYYANSEISLIDALAIGNVASLTNSSCSEMILANLAFADRIYTESKTLDNYDEANKLTDNLKLLYKRYDLLRTLLWTSATNAQEQCNGDFSIVIYLYDRETEDLTQKATQNVWSKVLTELKDKKGGDIILIPISNDKSLSSLQLLIAKYHITSFPVVIIDGKVIIQLKSEKELEGYTK